MRPAFAGTRLAAAAGVLFALSACASGMSKRECLYADWRAIGYEDGARGLDASAVGLRREACANKANVTADMDAYLEGREAGLSEFCRPANGFDHGARGGRYAGACSGKGEEPFVVAYQRGLTLYGLTRALDEAEDALAHARTELDGTDRAIAAEEAAIISPATPHLERIDHLAALKSLTERREALRRRLPRLAAARDRAAADVDDYRHDLASLNHDAAGPRRISTQM